MQDVGAAGSSLEPDRRAIKNLLKEITATGESADGVLTSVRTLSGWICGGALARPFPCLLYTSPSPRDRQKSRMPSSA